MLLLALLAVAGGAAFGSMTASYYTLLPLATPRALVGRVGSTTKTVTHMPSRADGASPPRPGPPA
ncbi:hypothetical protein WME99_51390 [Sorangium sp. So ce136]|uniref:hypothetical protein n=1 Tax=Sorangium sp. So ce136 TaxID=3133284 RepID=UPI003F05D9D4